jgi:hypothetical protein
MKTVRILIVVFGILLPYLSRIPGAFVKGSDWFTSYLDGGIGGFIFFGIFEAICWGSILIASFSYRHPSSIWFPAVFGFAFPVVGNAFLDLSSSSTAAVALVFIPIYSLPLVVIGGFIGLWFDRRLSKRNATPSNSGPN